MIIFDTETTGIFNAKDAPLRTLPKIIELYAKKVDDTTLEMVDELDLLIDPQELITEEITNITSITNEMLKGKGNFASHFPRISDFWLGERWVCGHNATFDCDMLEIDMRRCGKISHFPWTPNRLCTVELTEHFEGRRMKLIDLHTYLFGVGFESAHRARADVDATYACVFELHKRGLIPSLNKTGA